MKKKEKIDNEIMELKEKLAKKQEELEVVDFKDKANENPILQRNGVIVVQSSEHYFYRIMTFLFFLLLLAGLTFMTYLFLSGKADEFIKPAFFNSVNNQYQNNFTINPNIPIDNNINNEYQIYNNYTINLVQNST